MSSESKPTADLPPPAPTADVRLFVPFLNAIRGVFDTMVGMPVTVLRPAFKTDAAPAYDVTGIIGFTGDLAGSVAVSFRAATAARVVAAFAGVEIDPASADFPDAVGELTNLIAGSAKRHLGPGAGITCPTVVLGTGHAVARLRDVPCLLIPCETAAGPFAVEVSIKQVARAKDNGVRS